MRAKRFLLGCVAAFLTGMQLLSAAGVQFSYDTLQRLTRVTHADGTTIEYVYDALGNRLMKTTTLPDNPANLPPAMVSGPNIANGAINVATTPTLTWSPAVDPNSGDSVVYYLYFGTSPTPPLVFSGWGTNWSTGQLRSLTTYYWQVVARDNHNAESRSPVWSFTTSNAPPLADFVTSSPYGLAPLTVRFSDRSSSVDDAVVAWDWDFNDDGSVEARTRSAVWTFSNPGSYSVRLTVRDEHGASSSVVRTSLVNVVSQPVADLAPLRISIIPRASGDALLIYAVTNRGTTTLSAPASWSDCVYGSKTFELVEGDYTLLASFEERSPLPAGGFYVRTNVLRAPILNHVANLVLKVDGKDYLPELNETNNQMGTAMPYLAPDLAVTELRVINGITSTTGVQVVWGVANKGLGTAPAGWYDRVALSTNEVDPTIIWNLSATYRTEVLHPGSSYRMTNTVILPSLAEGEYRLWAAADNEGVMADADEENNVRAVPLVVGRGSSADLAPIELVVPNPLIVGQQVPFIWAITNQGPITAEGGWWDGLYLASSPPPAERLWELGLLYRQGGLRAGASYRATNVVRIPQVQAGTYYVAVKADDEEEVEQSSRANDLLVLEVEVRMGNEPDLEPFALSAPSLVFAGEEVQVGWDVANRGISVARPTWEDAVYLITTPDPSGAYAELGRASHTTSLASGGVYSATNTVRIPEVVPADYYFVVSVNDSGNLLELRSENNGLWVPVKVLGEQPLLRATLGADGLPLLILYGSTNASYAIEGTTNLIPPISWSPQDYTVVAVSNGFQAMQPSGATNRTIFYRARRE